MEYNQIFRPDTLEKLNKRSQENLKKMMGDKTLMQTMMSSTRLLQEIMAIEAPYKDQLEQLAINMVEDMYPIINEDGINIDAKITNVDDVNRSLDEIKINKPVDYPSPGSMLDIFIKNVSKNPNHFRYEELKEKYPKYFKSDINESTPESKRRIINGITQGGALHGTFSFYMFKEYLDAIDDTLVEKYNQLMKEVFGVYDDDNAIAMFLQMIAQGQKMGGGSSKVVVNEIKIEKPETLNQKKEREFEKLYKKLEEEYPNLHAEVLFRKAWNIIDKKYSLDEIKINKPKKYFTINNDEDRNKFKQLATKNNWINYTGDMAEDFYYPNGSQLYLFNGYIHNKTEELTENNTQQGPTIQARAICFPMLVHEVIKGLYELVSLQGFSGTKDQNQDVVDKVDKLENEPLDLKYGKYIYEALNDIYAESGYDDSRIREFFFAEVYQLGDQEFVDFVENALNDELTPQQKSWIKQTLKEIQMDLRSDDFDQSGIE